MKHLQFTQKEFINFKNLVYNKLLYSYEIMKNTIISVSFEDNTINNNLIEELGY